MVPLMFLSSRRRSFSSASCHEPSTTRRCISDRRPVFSGRLSANRRLSCQGPVDRSAEEGRGRMPHLGSRTFVVSPLRRALRSVPRMKPPRLPTTLLSRRICAGALDCARAAPARPAANNAQTARGRNGTGRFAFNVSSCQRDRGTYSGRPAPSMAASNGSAVLNGSDSYPAGCDGLAHAVVILDYEHFSCAASLPQAQNAAMRWTIQSEAAPPMA